MLRWLERLLNLRKGDLAQGSLLFAYYFLVIAGYGIGKVASGTLFLDRFDARQLPMADIAIAVLVGVTIAGYIRISRRVGLAGLLVGSLVLFSAVAFGFWWAFTTYRWDWLFPALYIWVGVFGVLAITQVWTLANFMLTTREAKRIFGLVGGGGITGGIFGGFVSSRLAGTLGTESLLAALGGLFALCALLVPFIWLRRERGASGSVKGLSGEGPRSFRDSLDLVARSSHLRSIAALICVGSIVTATAGWQFKAVAELSFEDPDQLASFFGSFDQYAGVLALAAQFLLTSRILQRFGLGLALLVLPAALGLGSAGVLIWGNIYAVTLLKGSDKVLRYSVDTSALQLLYLPVPTKIKIQVKSFIDTVVWRLGDGLAGVVLLVFATWLGVGPRAISLIALVSVGVWLVVAYRARGAYLTSLGHGLRQHRIDSEEASAPVLDRSTTSLIAEKLTSSDPEEILYGLSLFEVGYHQTAHPAMRGLIRHPSAPVRAKALAILSQAGDGSLVGEARSLLADGSLQVRTEALGYLTRHAAMDPLKLVDDPGDFSQAAVRSSIVLFLSRPGEGQNLDVARMMLDAMLEDDGPDRDVLRLEAGRLVAASPHTFEAQLSRLLDEGVGVSDESHAELVRCAIEGAGSLGRVELGPRLLQCLGDPRLGEASARALAGFGNRILPVLDEHLRDPGVPMEIRREIPEVLRSIGTREAHGALVENLLQGDTALRFRIIAVLNKLGAQRRDLGMDRQLIETVLAAELLGHYRSYQAYGALEARMEPTDPALAAFRESLDKEVERVFRLLGLLYPDHDLHSVHVGVRSSDLRLHDDALEYLDAMLPAELCGLLVPLVDGGVTVRERTERAKRLLGQEVASSEDAVRMLAATGDPWLRSCAAYAIGSLGLVSLAPELAAMEADPDPLLAETVREARSRLSRAAKAP